MDETTLIWATGVHAALYCIFVFALGIVTHVYASDFLIIVAQALAYGGMAVMQFAGNKPGLWPLSQVLALLSIIFGALAGLWLL